MTPDAMDLLTTNWLAILGIIVSVLAGVLLSRHFFYKKSKLAYYSVRSQNIVRHLGSKPESLQILYSGQQIDTLTATKIILWNGGRDTIKSEDVVDVEPITVHAKDGCKILGTATPIMNEKANGFVAKLAEDKSHVDILFKYMDRGQGAIIQLLHTGSSSKDIRIHGKVMGAGSPIRKSVPSLEELSFLPLLDLLAAKKHKVLAVTTVFLVPVIFALLIFVLPYPTDLAQHQILSFIAVVMFFGLYWGTALYYTLRRKLPKGLETFWED